MKSQLEGDMPRANRYFLQGHLWHITHRCHKREFLLKFAVDRRCWLNWLFEAKKRYGLCILNFIVTSNHIHLLVQDNGRGEIAKSMQLVAGRVAQQYNRRKRRKGAFWEDRYHATAIAANSHLARCLTYIDLNMVRAGVVKKPVEWEASGYADLMEARQRYNLVDYETLSSLLGLSGIEEIRQERRKWLEEVRSRYEPLERDPCWSESLAVGDGEFVAAVKESLGFKGRKKVVAEGDQMCVLRETEDQYVISPPKTPF